MPQTPAPTPVHHYLAEDDGTACRLSMSEVAISALHLLAWTENWAEVTCGQCRLEQPPAGAPVHHASVLDERTACGIAWQEAGADAKVDSDWSEVTCGRCRLEQPAAPKTDEYFTKGCGADVLARDAEAALDLLAGKREARLRDALAEVDAVEAKAIRMIHAYANVLADCGKTREALLRLLSGTQSAERAEEVRPEELTLVPRSGMSQALRERTDQAERFNQRMREARRAYNLATKKALWPNYAKQQVVDEDHIIALWMESIGFDEARIRAAYSQGEHHASVAATAAMVLEA